MRVHAREARRHVSGPRPRPGRAARLFPVDEDGGVSTEDEAETQPMETQPMETQPMAGEPVETQPMERPSTAMLSQGQSVAESIDVDVEVECAEPGGAEPRAGEERSSEARAAQARAAQARAAQATEARALALASCHEDPGAHKARKISWGEMLAQGPASPLADNGGGSPGDAFNAWDDDGWACADTGRLYDEGAKLSPSEKKSDPAQFSAQLSETHSPERHKRALSRNGASPDRPPNAIVVDLCSPDST